MNTLALCTPNRSLPLTTRNLNRLFQDPFTLWNQPFFSETSNPSVIIFETAEEFTVQAELPGWGRDQITIDFDKHTLTLKGNRELPNGEGRKYHRVEGFFGEFSRSFTFPDSVDAEAIKADLRDGVLSIRLPKREGIKARTIAIETN
ncbi:MAG: Hsp20/alpha crystallin family protein [Blastocatellia bacterium]|nr:Hsp20/alpha crystallin family protein [Blastocatellia bacterium]